MAETSIRPLFTLAEVAQIARRSRRSVSVDIAKGRLKIVRIGGSSRVHEDALHSYLSGKASA